MHPLVGVCHFCHTYTCICIRLSNLIAVYYLLLEFDTEKTGFLEASVIRKKLSSLGEDQLSAAELDKLLSLVDQSNENGKVNYKGKLWWYIYFAPACKCNKLIRIKWQILDNYIFEQQALQGRNNKCAKPRTWQNLHFSFCSFERNKYINFAMTSPQGKNWREIYSRVNSFGGIYLNKMSFLCTQQKPDRILKVNCLARIQNTYALIWTGVYSYNYCTKYLLNTHCTMSSLL